MAAYDRYRLADNVHDRRILPPEVWRGLRKSLDKLNRNGLGSFMAEVDDPRYQMEYDIAGTVPDKDAATDMPKDGNPEPENTDDDGPSAKSLFKKSLKEKYFSQKTLKFKRGKLYVIKAKNVPGLRYEKRIYRVEQIIWSMNDAVDVSSVIVKQVAGSENCMISLSRDDCRMLHIRYKPGLRIMSMYLNWQLYDNGNQPLKQDKTNG